MFQKLRTVIYHVNELAKAKEFYINLTGIKPYFDEPFYVGFDINGCELGLDPDMSGIAEGNHSVSYWAVTDIHASVEKSVSLGATVVSPVTNVGAVLKQLLLQILSAIILV